MNPLKILCINRPRVLSGVEDSPSGLSNRALRGKSPLKGNLSGGCGGGGTVSLMGPVGAATLRGVLGRKGRRKVSLATVGSFEGGGNVAEGNSGG